MVGFRVRDCRVLGLGIRDCRVQGLSSLGILNPKLRV